MRVVNLHELEAPSLRNITQITFGLLYVQPIEKINTPKFDQYHIGSSLFTTTLR